MEYETQHSTEPANPLTNMAYTTATSKNGSYDDKKFSGGVRVNTTPRLVRSETKDNKRPIASRPFRLSRDVTFTTRLLGRYEHGKFKIFQKYSPAIG
jgi:hypothetical protein